MSEDTSEMANGRIAIGVDVGGSGIKAAVVDVESRPAPVGADPRPDADAVDPGRRHRLDRPARQAAVASRAVSATSTPVGIGLPGVTIDGRLKSAANIDPAWIDFPVVERMGRLLKRPVSIINDADAAGIAEMRFGVGADQPGVVIFLTLGTGVGSGVFNDGVLVPNTEFGQMEIRGRAAERRSAAAARVRRGLSWKAWAADLDEHLDRIEQLMWPNLMIIGGGVSKNADRFIPRLTVRCPVVAAALRNDAGIIGAAIVAAETAMPPAPAPDPRSPRSRCRRARLAGLPAMAAASGGQRRRSGRIIEARSHHREGLPDDDRDPRRACRPRRWSSAARPSTRPTARRSSRRPGRPARSIATAPLGGREDVDRAVAAAQAAFEDRKGWANWAAGKRGRSLAKLAALIKEHTEELAQLESRNVGKPITGARGEIIGVEPRLRLLRRRREQDLRPDDPGLEARPRPDPARADRRRRADRAVELPAADGLVEGRAGARRGQHRDPQARQLLPVDGDPARRAGARGGHPGRRPQRRDRPGRLGRRVDRGPSGRSARSPSPARRRPARRSCGWPRAT